MNLKTFTPEKITSLRAGGDPVFQMNQKNGMIRINEAACELLLLTKNKKLIFHQNSNDPTEWFVETSITDGFVLRDKNDRTNGLLSQSLPMVRNFFDSIGYEYLSGTVYLGIDPFIIGKRKLYPLITLKLLQWQQNQKDLES